jgi:DNA-binding GntR family transcriptional regulator
VSTAEISPKDKPTSTVDLIADSLRADILQDTLKSGQRLRQEEIATRFGVSKIPVREALFQLKGEGLVTFFPNRGAVVSELSIAEVDEIYTLRIALETVALRRAIPHLTIANLSRAEKILGALDREQNAAQWGKLNWEFHSILYHPANLPRLMEWVRTLHINSTRYVIIYLLASPDHRQVTQDEHRQILEACRHGDTKATTAYLEHHLQSTANHLVAFLEQREPKISQA